VKQPSPLYGTAPAVSRSEPSLAQHLPDLVPPVRRRCIQLVTGIFETRSLLIATSKATGDPLGAPHPARSPAHAGRRLLSPSSSA
jgi:hypothetical protein